MVWKKNCIVIVWTGKGTGKDTLAPSTPAEASASVPYRCEARVSYAGTYSISGSSESSTDGYVASEDASESSGVVGPNGGRRWLWLD